MPWKMETIMSPCKKFVIPAQSPGVNMRDLCLRVGTSRKTGCKWPRRFL